MGIYKSARNLQEVQGVQAEVTAEGDGAPQAWSEDIGSWGVSRIPTYEFSGAASAGRAYTT